MINETDVIREAVSLSQKYGAIINRSKEEAVYQACLDMTRFNYQQFKECLEKKKEKLVRLQDDVSNQREFDLIDYRISLIEEMIVELFGEE